MASNFPQGFASIEYAVRFQQPADTLNRRVTIRRILLMAFLLVSLAPAALLTVLAFYSTRATMLEEIEQGVRRSAASVSSDVDKIMFERLLNATTWNHLEVMQDLRLGDVDKRLSGFLSEIKLRYGGVYRELHAVDMAGKIVASSSALRIGQQLPPGKPWLRADLPGDSVHLQSPAAGPAASRSVAIRSDILSQFGEGQIGELVLEVDWAQVEHVLDLAATPTRQILVLDHEGRVAAASAGLRARSVLQGRDASSWLPLRPGAGVETRDGRPLLDDAAIMGYDRSRGFERFPGFGWTYLLLQSRAEALAPVQHMAWIFAGLMAAIAGIVILVSLWVAGAIARPVIALTEFTRRYLGPGEPPPIPRAGLGELGELNRSFMQMVEDLQQSQKTLSQASKLAALGEVTALLAHEVRTPLGILRSSAQMLRTEPLSAEGRELQQIIESETERLNRLVTSLLDSTRTRPPHPAPTNLHALISHAATLLAAQARDCGIALKLDLRAGDPMLDCDAEQITQVLLNLIMNAIQILPAGRHIVIGATDTPDQLLLSVDDDGPGVAEEDRHRIFEPFVFKREGGIGLGLAVVRQIVRSHGGDISAEKSTLGGACFRVWLPR